jgi:UDP-N-acetylmuramyl pentapeptide phosphotransferase/UDP-N-acetylglucosamine-1-phosphate transferase
VNFAAITLCVVSQRVFIVVVVVYFVIDSVRKLLDTPLYVKHLIIAFSSSHFEHRVYFWLLLASQKKKIVFLRVFVTAVLCVLLTAEAKLLNPLFG